MRNRHILIMVIGVFLLLLSNNGIAREQDKKFNLMLDYGLVNLPFPSSIGLEASFFITPGATISLDYQKSTIPLDFFSFEFGNLSESNLVIQSRLYPSKRFNLLFGLGKRKTSLNLATTYFQLLTGTTTPVSELEATILRLGAGHKWTLKKKYRLAIDWIHLDIPIRAKTNVSASSFADPEDVDDVQNAEKIMRWYPSGVLAQFKIGLAF